MSIRILLIDDHAIVRQGLRAVLESQSDLTVIGEAGDGRQGLEMAEKLAPDVVIMDVAMPDLNGVEATRKITAADGRAKVLALSAYSEREFVAAMVEAGAAGYVLKAGPGEELLAAVRAIARGRKYLSPGVAHVVVDGFVSRNMPGEPPAQHGLAPREREVLQLVAEGHTSGEIGAKLGITEQTVEVHRRNIMKKLDLHSVAEITKYAIRRGITSL